MPEVRLSLHLIHALTWRFSGDFKRPQALKPVIKFYTV